MCTLPSTETVSAITLCPDRPVRAVRVRRLPGQRKQLQNPSWMPHLLPRRHAVPRRADQTTVGAHGCFSSADQHNHEDSHHNDDRGAGDDDLPGGPALMAAQELEWVVVWPSPRYSSCINNYHYYIHNPNFIWTLHVPPPHLKFWIPVR